MNANTDIDDIDKVNTRKLHILTSTIDFCHDICVDYYMKRPLRIICKFLSIFMLEINFLGPRHIVEIDERCFGKRKYNRRRLHDAQQ